MVFVTKMPAQQIAEADPLIEVFIVACLGFAAFRVKLGGTAQPACGLAQPLGGCLHELS